MSLHRVYPCSDFGAVLKGECPCNIVDGCLGDGGENAQICLGGIVESEVCDCPDAATEGIRLDDAATICNDPCVAGEIYVGSAYEEECVSFADYLTAAPTPEPTEKPTEAPVVLEEV